MTEKIALCLNALSRDVGQFCDVVTVGNRIYRGFFSIDAVRTAHHILPEYVTAFGPKGTSYAEA